MYGVALLVKISTVNNGTFDGIEILGVDFPTFTTKVT